MLSLSPPLCLLLCTLNPVLFVRVGLRTHSLPAEGLGHWTILKLLRVVVCAKQQPAAICCCGDTWGGAFVALCCCCCGGGCL
jgi:hypothetical protein